MPRTVDAKMLLYSSILDPNPVIFLEHRWLHDVKERCLNLQNQSILAVQRLFKLEAINNCINVLLDFEALLLQSTFFKWNETEIVDLRSVKPIDFDTIFASLDKQRDCHFATQASPRVLLPVNNCPAAMDRMDLRVSPKIGNAG